MALSEDQKAMLRLLAQREEGYDDIAALTGLGVADVRTKIRGALADLDSGLSQDQKAMLRLQAQREDGYDDIAALTGSSVEEVRAKVKDALAALAGDVVVAKPAAPRKAPEPPPPPPPPERRAAPTPKAPAPAERRAAKRVAPGGLKLPEDKGLRRALAAGGAVVLVIALLLITGVLGGGDDGSDSGTPSSGESTLSGESTVGGEAATPTGGKEPTQALLSAVDGSDARGQAVFGRFGQTAILVLAVKGLRPSPKGQVYTVSLARSPSQRQLLTATEATDSGIIAGRFKVAPEAVELLAAGFDEMEVSLVDEGVLRAALAQARKSQKAPDYDGTAVLSGPVTGPIVEAGEG